MNIPTIPTYLGEEKVLNPFLMFDDKKLLKKNWFRKFE